jgi:hypothetical protein
MRIGAAVVRTDWLALKSMWVDPTGTQFFPCRGATFRKTDEAQFRLHVRKGCTRMR